MENAALHRLRPMIGTWNWTGRHPYFPDRTFRGQATFEWIESGAFLVMRSRGDDPIPAGVAIFGTDDGESKAYMLYFDERGVSRKYDVEIHAEGLSWSREMAEFSQRVEITFAHDGRTMEARGEMSKNGGAWEKDLDTDYERVG